MTGSQRAFEDLLRVREQLLRAGTRSLSQCAKSASRRRRLHRGSALGAARPVDETGGDIVHLTPGWLLGVGQGSCPACRTPPNAAEVAMRNICSEQAEHRSPSTRTKLRRALLIRRSLVRIQPGALSTGQQTEALAPCWSSVRLVGWVSGPAARFLALCLGWHGDRAARPQAPTGADLDACPTVPSNRRRSAVSARIFAPIPGL